MQNLSKEVTLKNNIKEHRKQAHLTQKQLADDIGITRQSIVSIEKGHFNPTTKVAFLISNRLGIAVDELFYLE